MTTTNLMFDLETGGKSDTPNCPHGVVILSIGATVFDPWMGIKDRDSLLKDSFYCNVCPTSCEEIGLIWDESTRVWWSEQSEEARAALLDNQLPIWRALDDFASWIVDRDPKITGYWANSPSFDAVILRRAFVRLKRQLPPSFYTERDMRTIKWLAGLDDPDTWRPDFMAESVAHNALDDAVAQAQLVQYCISSVGLQRGYAVAGEIR